jgi:hypothetical protein
MCSINHDLKAIYIHIPKNGGSSIANILETYYGFKKKKYFCRSDHDEFDKEGEFYEDIYLVKHENGDNVKLGFCNLKKKGILKYFMSSKEYDEIMDMNSDKWKDYYKFTFIRNPYDKIVSAYYFINRTLQEQSRVTYDDLLTFLKNKENCDNWVYGHGFQTQYNNLLDINNEINFNYIGNFDNLNTELIEILKNIGIPKITHHKFIEKNLKFNETIVLKKYVDHYDDEILQLVNEYFKVDFEHFGFKKCETIDELKDEWKKEDKKRELFVKKNEEIMKNLNDLDLTEDISEENETEKGKKFNKLIDCLEKNQNHEFLNFLSNLVVEK